MILLISLGILFYIIYHHFQSQMTYLIQQCENIIEDQSMSPIDGEGNISILSFQLATLQKSIMLYYIRCHRNRSN